MPTPPLPPRQDQPAQLRVYLAVLDYVRALRTAPVGAEEAIEWATLEREFTQRSQALDDECTTSA